jgi:hypothetical protein
MSTGTTLTRGSSRFSCAAMSRSFGTLRLFVGQLLGSGLLPANFPNHTPKSCRREELFSFSWIFVSGGRSSASGSDLGRSMPEGQSSNELRFCLSHFLPHRTSSKRIGPRAVPRLFCGDVRLANTIRSSATDAAASRRTMNITTGLASGAVVAPVVGRPSPSCRYFLFLTRTTVCWHAARHCGGASQNTAPGKRQCPRSKTLIACPILPHFAAGPTDWTALSQPFLFSAKRSPA